MHDDAEARKTVRDLLKRFEATMGLGIGMAYVLAAENRQQYAKLLESAERASELVARPVIESDANLNRAYAALDASGANWCDAGASVLSSPGEESWGEEAVARMKVLEGLNARFHVAEREAKDRHEGDPGIGS